MLTTFRSAVLTVLLVAVPVAFTLAGALAEPGNAPSVSDIKASLDKTPKALFLQPKFEFAPVYEGTDVKHDFVVENTGEAPLVIKNIRPD